MPLEILTKPLVPTGDVMVWFNHVEPAVRAQANRPQPRPAVGRTPYS